MKRTKILASLALMLSLLMTAVSVSAEVKARYLYTLSGFDGVRPFSGGAIALDRFNDEVFVMSGEAVTIFNSSGMETFSLEYDPSVGIVYDAAFKPDGNMILLVLKDGGISLSLCNYRAEPISSITLKDLPEEFASFSPSRVIFKDGRLYLVSTSAMQVVVTDDSGYFLKGYDVGALLGMGEAEVAGSGMNGVTLSDDGRIAFVLASSAQVTIMSPDGSVAGFGKRGSGPGKFGVPTGVAMDQKGNILVSDRLRSVVLIFDKSFSFVTEFGFRGLLPGNLIVPGEIKVDDAGRVYITQLRRRGVNVYQLSYD